MLVHTRIEDTICENQEASSERRCRSNFHVFQQKYSFQSYVAESDIRLLLFPQHHVAG